ncbi:formate dehydrogenase accessory sulfurtransferase FdhD [Yimella sp. cx-51]|uniref:formate dehydrogenase accessory sulfurtransferase FdhD n=1 Tax=Yimella sp. cx-51 TaxID=2770551 RepID=UPI00165E583E|nr:formate dehydrogenase accessory sulfurtransferase FdhD [Yimella sp. cx-51]MBC9957771.1 formate dehydrogenase accessory sulfurtransferase FdhD [Yimella sp. cx-51]QTH36886.1 formate dehydrogenase accessory sulfurtransferase FdhD [Yimella sp. cx-51]
MGRRTARRRLTQVSFTGAQVRIRERAEEVAVEEPLEIRVAGQTVTVTMRLPGNDMELVHGLLVAEGIVHAKDDVLVARYCADTDTMNVIDVTLSDGPRPLPVNAQRTLVMHGGCGLCGKASIDAITGSCPPATVEVDVVDASVIRGLADKLLAQQPVRARTGGTHGAGLFTRSGDLVVAREDIGRHNAVDKVIGWSVMNDHDRSADVLMVSSRASFDIVQKAAMAGIGVLCCVSAPSELAIDAAQETGVTLVAFDRGDRFTICTHAKRITIGAQPAPASDAVGVDA